jgi:hypothetical protein
MTPRRVAALVGIGALVVGLGWLMFSFLERRLSAPTPDAEPVTPAAETPAAVGPRISAILYFVSEDGTLLEPRAIDVPLRDSPAAQARALVEAQLAATPPEPLTRAVPEGVTVRGVFLTGRDDAYVDLDAAGRIAQRAHGHLRHRLGPHHEPHARHARADPDRWPRGRDAHRTCGLA